MVSMILMVSMVSMICLDFLLSERTSGVSLWIYSFCPYSFEEIHDSHFLLLFFCTFLLEEVISNNNMRINFSRWKGFVISFYISCRNMRSNATKHFSVELLQFKSDHILISDQSLCTFCLFLVGDCPLEYLQLKSFFHFISI